MEEKKEKTKEVNLETIKEVEKNKQEITVYDLEQIYENYLKFKDVLERQLTQILVQITKSEKEIEGELKQFWIKEMPIRKSVQSYMMQIANLIGIYTQMENEFKVLLKKLLEYTNYPDFDKIEERYLKEIEKLRKYILYLDDDYNMKLKDLKSKFDGEMDLAIKKARVEVHREYEPKLIDYENRLDDAEKRTVELERLVYIRSEIPKKNIHLPSVNQDIDTNVQKPEQKPKLVEESEAVPLMPGEDKVVPAMEQLKEDMQELTKKYKTDGKYKVTVVHKPDFRKELFQEIGALAFHNKSYNEMKKILCRKYSSATFFKYLNELIDLGVIEKTGEGKKARLILHPDALREGEDNAKEEETEERKD